MSHSGSVPTSSSEAVRKMRQETAGDAEPLSTETRSVVKHGRGLYINPTKYGVMTHDIQKGDDVTVDTYPDRIVLRFDGGE